MPIRALCEICDAKRHAKKIPDFRWLQPFLADSFGCPPRSVAWFPSLICAGSPSNFDWTKRCGEPKERRSSGAHWADRQVCAATAQLEGLGTEMRNAPLRIFVAVLLLIQPWKGGLPDLHPQNLMELGLQLKLELAATNGSSASVLHIRCSRR